MWCFVTAAKLNKTIFSSSMDESNPDSRTTEEEKGVGSGKREMTQKNKRQRIAELY